MSRVWFIIGLTAILLAMPAVVCAQGFGGIRTLINEGAIPNKLVINGAWVKSLNTHYSIDRWPHFLGIGTGDWSYNYDAFQIGLGLPLAIGDRGEYGTLVLGGTIALPSTSHGEEVLSSQLLGTVVARKWDVDTFFGTVEALWAYPVSSNFSALAGFRWVCWQTSYTDPYDGFVSVPTDTADVTVNGYVPFVGVMTTLGGLSLGVVGIPTTLGDVEHREIVNAFNRLVAKGNLDGGYFVEAFLEYSLPALDISGLPGDFSGSLFCKVSKLHATSTVTMKDLFNPLFTPRDYDFKLDRDLLTAGAKVTYVFDITELINRLSIY